MKCCIYCGIELTEDSLFCIKCGRKQNFSPGQNSQKEDALNITDPVEVLQISEEPIKASDHSAAAVRNLLRNTFIELSKCFGLFCAVIAGIALVSSLPGISSLFPSMFMKTAGKLLLPSLVFWTAIFFTQEILADIISFPRRLHFWLFITLNFLAGITACTLEDTGFKYFWVLYQIANFYLICVFLLWILFPFTLTGKKYGFDSHSAIRYVIIFATLAYPVYFTLKGVYFHWIERITFQMVSSELWIWLVISLTLLCLIHHYDLEKKKLSGVSLPGGDNSIRLLKELGPMNNNTKYN